MTNENLQIDPSQLDEEWLQQPLLFSQAVDEAADCQKIVDDLKEEKDKLKTDLEWLEADRANYLRKAFEKEGFAKPPAQAMVDDWVTKQPEIKVARDEIHEKQKEINEESYKLNLAKGEVKSLEQRKDTLENLCKLHGMNYFSVPNPGHMLDGGKRFIEANNQNIEEKSAEATTALNEKKKTRTGRTKDGKTKEEVLDDISNPETREAAKEAIEKEESQEQEPKQRRRRR